MAEIVEAPPASPEDPLSLQVLLLKEYSRAVSKVSFPPIPPERILCQRLLSQV